MKVKEICIGGWFQRTALHLHEMYSFLKYAESDLGLNKKKLEKLQKAIGPQDVTFVMGELDHISFSTDLGIEVTIYEDGLITLRRANPTDDLQENFKLMSDYYEKQLSVGFSYIFSLGAPVPKELARIETIYPYFIVLQNATQKTVTAILEQFGERRYSSVKKTNFEVIRGDTVYIFNNKKSTPVKIHSFIEETIFTREFQAQLQRYLNLHRHIWDKIAHVKERGSIKGGEASEFKAKVESYAKTINLIDTRISQMGTYIGTRAKITKAHMDDSQYRELLEYRYETLENSLKYTKDIWVMTQNYVDSALDVFSGIQGKATENSIKGLTVITTVGVLASMSRLAATDLSRFSLEGAGYLILLLVCAWGLGYTLKELGQRKEYKIKNISTTTD